MQNAPIRRLPENFTAIAPNPPANPDGSQLDFVLAADASQLILGPAHRNRRIDLAGHEVVDLILGDGFDHFRLSNGRAGTIRSASMAALTPERANSVFDGVIDNILCTGRGPHREGNQIRGERLLIADIKSCANSARGAADGFENYALWLDYGSHDVLVQDCDLWTRGGQACFRSMAGKRILANACVFGSVTGSHCVRFHGPSSSRLGEGRDLTPCEDVGIYDCTLRGRGLMAASEPDGTETYPDTVRRLVVRDSRIYMSRDSQPGQDATLMFLPPGMTPYLPDGRPRLQGLDISGLTYYSTWDPMPQYVALAQTHPDLAWHFANMRYAHI
jgi:hypothetical protein